MDTTDTGTKPWYLSKGVIGSLVAGSAVITGFFGVKLDPTTQQVVTDQVTAFATAGTALAGTALALYGRVTARKVIG